MQPFTQSDVPLIGHEEPGRRLTITATLVLDQPLHVGSGHGGTISELTTDSAIIRDHTGRPIIPGSSLRGALRNRCERLADALLPDDRKICFLYEQNGVNCVSINPDLLRGENDELLPDKDLWQTLPSVLCPSCRLFGASAYWASKIRIPDLAPQQAEPTSQIKHGVGIHRDTQTAAPTIKYDQEILHANTTFTLEIIVENPDDDDLSLLALGLTELANGRIPLGGNSARGLGGCHLKDGQVAWVDLSQPQDLISYLTTHTYPHTQDLTPWLQTHLNRWV